MHSIDHFEEILSSIRQNPIRTVLAGFGVAWGIFILTIMLGIGQGFQDGVMEMFNAFAQKSMFVYGNHTSLKYNNYSEGREVIFDEAYLKNLKDRYEQITAISPQKQLQLSVKHGNKTNVFTTIGINEDYFRIKILEVTDEGRLFNSIDLNAKRNVVIVGEGITNFFFNQKQAINNYVEIAGVLYKIIGVLKDDNIFAASDVNTIYLPYKTLIDNIKDGHGNNSDFHAFALLLQDNTDTKQFEDELRKYIAHKSNFDSDDAQALYIANYQSQTESFDTLFRGLKGLIWIIGLCFLLSGIVGICNIMLIIVRERTCEIGIRKAIGALSKDIILMIIIESISITLISGLFGIILGYGVLQLIEWLIGGTSYSSLIPQITFDLSATLFALLILVITGTLAGLFPSMKAAQIMPINAINQENRG
ncbi:ABC transporter permease [Bacteroidia bacterium]|nr:ABC transporter permease [Bacteroidia bacterium]